MVSSPCCCSASMSGCPCIPCLYFTMITVWFTCASCFIFLRKDVVVLATRAFCTQVKETLRCMNHGFCCVHLPPSHAGPVASTNPGFVSSHLRHVECPVSLVAARHHWLWSRPCRFACVPMHHPSLHVLKVSSFLLPLVSSPVDPQVWAAVVIPTRHVGGFLAQSVG